MPIGAPLRVTAEIELQDGEAAGQRRFRLSHALTPGDPPRLWFDEGLPLEGEGRGSLRFELPVDDDGVVGGLAIACEARLRCDPERPERGSEAELLGLSPEQRAAIERYIEQRTKT